MNRNPFNNRNNMTNYNNINNTNSQNISMSNMSLNLPSEEEIYGIQPQNQNNQDSININDENINEFDFNLDDVDENIHINVPRCNINPFQNSHLIINNNDISNLNNNNNNNENNINFNFNYSINNYQNNNIINNNSLMNNPNFINRINSRSESFLDENGNVIYRNNTNNIKNINNINNDYSRRIKVNEPQIVKLDSHRIKVGENEFEDLTNEAREIQNKEAFEKKILGIVQNKKPEVQIPQPKNSFLDRVENFIDEHEEGIFAILDGIGCILLHGPSIDRTIDRIENYFSRGYNPRPQLFRDEPNDERNILREIRLEDKNKDYDTIIKFLPIWEIKENKKDSGNNENKNCIICLYDFKIGDQICALPCLHIFHFDCIKNWLRNNLSCPVCKFEVTLNSIIGQNNS